MILNEDKELLKSKGIKSEQVQEQVKQFKSGFPDLEIVNPATIKNGGIKSMAEKRLMSNIKYYDKASKRIKRMKFVPASGAASRMFQALFEFMNNYKGTQEEYLELTTKKDFGSLFYLYANMHKLALYADLKESFAADNLTPQQIEQEHEYVYVLKKLLTEDGLNYGNLPKGLLKFHKGVGGYARTPFEEHLVEGANYSATGKKVYLHFTVSPHHLDLFKKHLNEVLPQYQKKYKVKYDIEFSIQKSETDTVAVDVNNELFRDSDNNIVFRPGGHGALIQNLNELDADLIFVKNIDNVVQDRLKKQTYIYKKGIAGLLLWHRDKVKDYLKKLDRKKVKQELIDDITQFMKRKLCIIIPEDFVDWEHDKQIGLLKAKLNRPIRVCGIVRNQGEAGGGPYWVKNEDGTTSLQIVEEAQIGDNYKPLMQKATHFNPVDLVCYIKDYKGKKFDLTEYVDKNAGFISEKSYQGKTLKALELPGLWNGAMSDWITIFVEVPIVTFNPVKTISDLLRQEHLFENDLNSIIEDDVNIKY